MSDPTDKPDLFKQDGKCDNFRRKGNSLLQIALQQLHFERSRPTTMAQKRMENVTFCYQNLLLLKW